MRYRATVPATIGNLQGDASPPYKIKEVKNMARTNLTMTRLAEAIDDQTFQISALTKRVKELEEQRDLDATFSSDVLSSDTYVGRSNVRWLSDRISKLEKENTALGNSLHRDRQSHESSYRDLVKRLRELERIAHTPKQYWTSDNPPQSEREKITEVIHDITQALVRIEKIIGTHGG